MLIFILNILIGTKQKLAIVILPFESGEAGELTLNVGDILEILHSNRSGWGVGKIKHNGYKGLFPVNFVEEITEASPDESVEKYSQQNDVYTWGTNVNFTLALGDSKNRSHPELVESLWEERINVTHIEVTKFHTIFLTNDGNIFSCGHGLGGRLGHDNEETLMYPKKIQCPINNHYKHVSAASHHTVLLDELGQVFTFGLNDFHQLGHTPPPKKCLTPTLISHKSLKGKLVIGIGAARFHSVLYTKYELYTFGLNAGQLGHTKGEHLQTTPKLVSSLYKKEACIKDVVVSNGASLCLMENGDLYLLNEYVCRKITMKMIDVVRMCMSGGTLDYKGMENTKPEPLKINILHQSGVVDSWRANYKNFKQCYWLGNKLINRKIIHLSLGKHLVLTTDDGQVYFGHFHSKEHNVPSQQTSVSLSHVTASKVEVVTGTFTLNEVMVKLKQKRKEYEEIHLEKVPLLYRSLKCFCDSESRTFAVIQADPRSGLSKFPVIRSSILQDDLSRLFTEASLDDQIHDAVIKNKSTSFPVHHFILQCRLQLNDKEIKSTYENIISGFKDHSDVELKSSLLNIYKGDGSLVLPGNSETILNIETKYSDEDVAFAYRMKNLSIADIENPLEEFSNNVEEASVSTRQRKKKRKSENLTNKEEQKSKHVTTLSHAKSNKKKNIVKFETLENWRKFSDLSDVTIETEDGKLLKCHKCILITRLEYFNNMLNNEWLESSLKNGSLKMPIPSNILNVVIHYLYTDEASVVNESNDISFIGEVLVCADQLLILRLKEICELALANKVSLKNAVELFAFACTFNVEQLKTFVCEYISLNLPYYLEARLLDDLSNEELRILSNVYKRMVVGMETRHIVPSTYHKELDHKKKLLEEKTLSELNKLKKKRRRTISNDETSQRNMSTSSMEDVFEQPSSPMVSKEPVPINTNKMQNESSSSSKVVANGASRWGVIQNNSNPSNILSNVTVLKEKPISSSPFKKKSQKERRQQRMQEPVVDDVTVENVKEVNGSPWSKSPREKPITSFRDLMSEEQSPIVNQSKSSKKTSFPRSASKKSKQISKPVERSDAERNPWQIVTPVSQNGVAEHGNNQFSTIINVQKEEKEELHVQSQKPITVIQLEERAMSELKHYYEANAKHSEFVTVNRIKMTAVDLPFWDRVII